MDVEIGGVWVDDGDGPLVVLVDAEAPAAAAVVASMEVMVGCPWTLVDLPART